MKVCSKSISEFININILFWNLPSDRTDRENKIKTTQEPWLRFIKEE